MADDRWVMEWQGLAGQPRRRTLTTPRQAGELFTEIDEGGEGPVLVDVYLEGPDGPVGGRNLTIGAGGSRSVVTFQRSYDPPYFVSQGSGDGEGETFAYGGTASPFPASMLIEKVAAVRALRGYVATGERPTSIHWDEVAPPDAGGSPSDKATEPTADVATAPRPAASAPTTPAPTTPAPTTPGAEPPAPAAAAPAEPAAAPPAKPTTEPPAEPAAAAPAEPAAAPPAKPTTATPTKPTTATPTKPATATPTKPAAATARTKEADRPAADGKAGTPA